MMVRMNRVGILARHFIVTHTDDMGIYAMVREV